MDQHLNPISADICGDQEYNSSHFLQLNDHCLLEICSPKAFNLMDLCSAAETCLQLQRVVRSAFPNDLCIRIRQTGTYNIRSKYQLTSTDGPGIERIFKNFGSLLTGISISIPRIPWSYEEYVSRNKEALNRQQQQQYDASNFVLSLVARFCVDNLKVLKISGLSVPRFITAELKPVFERLEVLKVRDAVLPDDETLFADCESLIELRVVHVDNCHAILVNHFPKLELFGYGKPYKPNCTILPNGSDSMDVVIGRLTAFLSLHHQSLKKIILANKTDNCFLQVFESGFDKLEEFGLNMSEMEVTCLHQLGALKSLKTLKLMHASCEDLTFVPAITKLRELYSYDCSLPKAGSFQFHFLLQLTKLHIMHGETPVPDVISIIRRLIHLQKLTIFDLEKFVLDEDTFSEIVDIVDGRPHRLTLKCKFNFDAKDWNDNRKVRLVPVERLPMHPNF